MFVANYGTDAIGEYTTSGTTVNNALITGLGFPDYVVASGSNLFVLNDTTGTPGTPTGTIGEYTLTGAAVNTALVTGLFYPASMVVSGSDLFVANTDSNVVAEYTTSGTLVNSSFLTLNSPSYMAVSGSDLYVVYNGSNGTTVGEYTTSGSTVNADLISGLGSVFGITAIPEPSAYAGILGALTLGFTVLRRKRMAV